MLYGAHVFDLKATPVRSRASRARDAVQLLLGPDSGLPGVCVRFVLAGGLATTVYLLITIVSADVIGLPFQIALIMGFCAAISVSFSSQRRFVWVKRERYRLPLHHQAGRYLLWYGTQYGATAIATLLLPSALGIPTEVVYVTMLALSALVNFLVMRYAIFHAAPSSAESTSRLSVRAGRGLSTARNASRTPSSRTVSWRSSR